MQWHKALGHCNLKVIEQLKKKENITVINKTKGPKTYKCEICALSKSKEIVSRRPLSKPATGLYKRIYFNLIIFNKGWEGSYYIVYYINKYTK